MVEASPKTSSVESVVPAGASEISVGEFTEIFWFAANENDSRGSRAVLATGTESGADNIRGNGVRSEEHTSELQSH